MSTYTDFMKLQKPSKDEKYDINIFNENSDLIDSIINDMNRRIIKLSDDNGNHDCNIAPQNVSNIYIKPGNTTLTVFWSDPENTIVGDQTVCTWKGTKLVMKVGAYPENINDGMLIVDNKIKDNYKTLGFKINNLNNGETYYFALFPYSEEGKININVENRITGMPKPYRIMTVNIDLSNSNPETCITYADDAVYMIPGSSEWDDFFGHYPVLFKDGNEVGRLDKNNFRQFETGEAADVTSGDAGDVMIAFPCRGLTISKNNNILTISMTDNEEDENFKYYAHTRGDIKKNKFYLGAYKSYVESSKIRSLSNKPITNNLSIGTYRNYAHENGIGYEQSGWHQLIFRQSMYLLKYKNLDSQTTIGCGYSSGNSILNTGNTDYKGMNYGTENANLQMKLFGLEDFWGNINEWIDGIYIDGGYIYVTIDNNEFANKGYSENGNIYQYKQLRGASTISGFISDVTGNTETGYLISNASGSSTTFFCDCAQIVTYSSYFYGFFNYSINGALGIFSLSGMTGYGSGKSDLNHTSIAARLMYL